MESVLVSLFLVLLLAWAAGILANRIGFPAVLGELMAGILIGPAVLGALIVPEWMPLLGGKALGFASQPAGLDVLAELGVFLLMLYIGLEVDFRDLWKAGRPGLLASVGGFAIPFAAGYFLADASGIDRKGALFLGLAMGVTSLAVNSRILADLRLFGTRVASVLLAGALISDTAALVFFALVMGLSGQEGANGADTLMVLGKNVLFFVVAVALGIKGLPLLGGFMGRAGLHGRTANFTLVMLIGLIYAELAHLLGLHAIVGAFLAGMFLREGVLKRRISHEITGLVQDLSLGFLAPVFFITAGFQVTLGVIQTHTLLFLAVLAVAMVSKILGVVFSYTLGGYAWREGLVIGLGMNGRGAVEIVFAEIALRLGVISQEVFSILVLMAILTSLTVPAALKIGVEWLRRRKELVHSDEARRGAIVVGAHPLGRAIGRELKERGEPVTVIDTNRSRCAAAEREGIPAVHGSAVSEEVLDIAGARTAQALLAGTSNASVNDMVMQVARELFRIPDIYTVQDSGPGKEAKASALPSAPDTPSSFGALPLFSHPVNLADWNRILLREEYRRETMEVPEPMEFGEFIRNREASGSAVLPLLVERQGRWMLPGDVAGFHAGDVVHYVRHRADTDPFRARLSSLLQSCPILDLSGPQTLESFLNQVAETMAGRLDVSAAELHTMLEEREKESSTVIAPGLAIPHVILQGAGRFEILVARCRKGVEFPDAGKVRTLFVLLSSHDERTMYLRTLSTIARMVGAARFERYWMEAAETEDLRALLLHTEDESAPKKGEASADLE